MHIRQVLTRAKLEKFQTSPAIYQALKNEKVLKIFIVLRCQNKKIKISLRFEVERLLYHFRLFVFGLALIFYSLSVGGIPFFKSF